MFWTNVCRFFLAGLVCVLGTAQTGTESSAGLETIQTLITKAAESRATASWANYLIQADTVADKLTLNTQAEECCGNRCVRVGEVELHYRFNGIAGQEDYQHDLLQLVAVAQQGTGYGADALVRLLPTGCQTIASQWTPYFRTVLGILELQQWKALPDIRLTRIRAEAYETWWSLSKLSPNDALVTDSRMNPADFREGVEIARERAIEGYQSLIKAGHGDADSATSLRLLLAGQDSTQRNWICGGD